MQAEIIRRLVSSRHEKGGTHICTKSALAFPAIISRMLSTMPALISNR